MFPIFLKGLNVLLSLLEKKECVILKAENYERLKEFELENAIREAEKDLKEAKYTIKTAEEHLKMLERFE